MGVRPRSGNAIQVQVRFWTPKPVFHTGVPVSKVPVEYQQCVSIMHGIYAEQIKLLESIATLKVMTHAMICILGWKKPVAGADPSAKLIRETL